MRIGIVTDSTADLPSSLLDRWGIAVVPALLILDGQEYVDGVNISRQEFYRRLPELKKVSTASPSAGEFKRVYQHLLGEGYDHIVSIHVAASLSGIYNAARLAAQEFGDRVTVIDSGQLSFGLGLQVLAAAEAASQANSLSKVQEAIVSARRRLWVKAALDTMEYLRRSGRVPAAVAMLGGALHIRPLIELRDGAVKAIGIVRTTAQADEWLAKDLRSLPHLERLAILHTGAEERARRFLERMRRELADRWPAESWLINVTSVIGAHLGPNGLGYAALRLPD
ncbi:MAG: DegV family protein [Anaerolineales bacterium]